jgi:hypothetical protein
MRVRGGAQSSVQFARLYFQLGSVNSSKADLNKLPARGASIVLRLLGPGLVTGAATDDPSGIETYSQAEVAIW